MPYFGQQYRRNIIQYQRANRLFETQQSSSQKTFRFEQQNKEHSYAKPGHLFS
jgi:hypothetical protein